VAIDRIGFEWGDSGADTYLPLAFFLPSISDPNDVKLESSIMRDSILLISYLTHCISAASSA
jgi:hypothetical protein